MIFLLQTQRRLPSGEVLPTDPQFALWYDRVNRGAKFRFDPEDCLLGAQGEPYLRLPLARLGEEGYTLAELALYLYNRNVGALLCHEDADVSNGSDNLPLSYGDIVDVLQTGLLLDRVPCTQPWGYPSGLIDKPDWNQNVGQIEVTHPEKLVGPLDEPDFVVLPRGVRRNIAWLMGEIDAGDVGVSLCYRPDDSCQFLWIMYRLSDDNEASASWSDAEFQRIAGRLIWYLPRYYAAVITPAENVKGYPLFPEADSSR